MNPKNIISILSLSFFIVSIPAYAIDPCAEKESIIQKQIYKANYYGHIHKSAALQQALQEIKDNCTPQSVKSDLENKIRRLEKKEESKKEDIKSIQEDLRQAVNDGDEDREFKYKRKLNEKKEDLQEISFELNKVRDELNGYN